MDFQDYYYRILIQPGNGNHTTCKFFFFFRPKNGKVMWTSWMTYTILTRILYLSVGYLGMYLDTPPTNWAAIREKTQNWPSGPVVGANMFIRQNTAKRTEKPSVPMPHDILMIFPWYFHDISMIFPWYFHDISMIFPWYFHDISVIPNLHILMIFGRLGG